MHRAHFLEKLVSGIPPPCTHLSKRLTKVQNQDCGSVKLHFQDGSFATADAVIGAEGIRSVVREHILGKELAEPVFSHSVVFRNIRDMDVVIDKLGAEYAGKASILCGPSEYIILPSLSKPRSPFLFPPPTPCSPPGTSPINQSIISISTIPTTAHYVNT